MTAEERKEIGLHYITDARIEELKASTPATGWMMDKYAIQMLWELLDQFTKSDMANEKYTNDYARAIKNAEWLTNWALEEKYYENL